MTAIDIDAAAPIPTPTAGRTPPRQPGEPTVFDTPALPAPAPVTDDSEE